MYLLIIYLFIFKFDKNTTIMSFNPADNIQDLQNFGEFGGVNPSISRTIYNGIYFRYLWLSFYVKP